uniref:Uncharacterized protein n=1 Tax=Oryza meridionalis TaxID=40149 RepID=A0A0E0D2I8_9ORYZ
MDILVNLRRIACSPNPSQTAAAAATTSTLPLPPPSTPPTTPFVRRRHHRPLRRRHRPLPPPPSTPPTAHPPPPRRSAQAAAASPPRSPTSAPLYAANTSSPSLQRSLTSAAANKMKKALGLRSLASSKGGSPGSGGSGGAKSAPPRRRELTRVQMRISEPADARIRIGLLRIAVSQAAAAVPGDRGLVTEDTGGASRRPDSAACSDDAGLISLPPVTMKRKGKMPEKVRSIKFTGSQSECEILLSDSQPSARQPPAGTKRA